MAKGMFAASMQLLDRIGNAVASPGAYTILGRLKALITDIVVTIGPGSSIIGKVGIDQTTDGTTNRVNAKIPDGLDATQGAIGDALVNAGATGTQSSKLRRVSLDLGTALTNLAALLLQIGDTDSPAADAGGEGDLAAKLRAISRDIGPKNATAAVAGGEGDIAQKLRAISRDLIANIVLAAGNHIIGKVGIDQTTPGTTNLVQVGGSLPAGDANIGNVDIVTQPAAEQTTPVLYNVTLTVADTQYSQALPANTRAAQFQCRTSKDIRYAFETGKVAGPTAPYGTLKQGMVWYKENIKLASTTLYFASSTAGVVVEIEAWT